MSPPDGRTGGLAAQGQPSGVGRNLRRLAESLGVSLLTADQRLARAASRSCAVTVVPG